MKEGFKTIDAHQHFWVYDPVEYGWIDSSMSVLKRDFLPGDLAPLLAAEGMSGCIAVQARQTEAETDFLLQLARENPFIKGVVGWLDLCAEHIEAHLEAYRPFGLLKGVRHIVQAEPDPDFLLREDFIRGVHAVGAAGLAYDILVFERQLPAVLRFLERCPNQVMVLDHIAKPVMASGPSADWKAHIRAVAEHPNAYCKVSGMVTEADGHRWSLEDFFPYLEVVTEAFGPERLMLGSDWPVCLLAAPDYKTVLHIVRRFAGDWSAPEQEALFGATAARCYKL